MRGRIGEAEKEGKTKQEVSKIDAETAVLETQRKKEKEKADAELAKTQADLGKEITMAKNEAKRTAEAQDAELQKVVEMRRAEMELERLRAKEVIKSRIAAESARETADASLYTQNKAADAVAYAKQKEADAALYAKRQEAEGLREMAHAYGSLAEVMGGPAGLMQFMMLKESTYEKLAHANAQAIQGLQPKITVWNTGSNAIEGGGGGAGTGNAAGAMDPTAPIRNIFQSLPPLLTTIHDQTGVAPPTWLARMPQLEDGKAQ